MPRPLLLPPGRLLHPPAPLYRSHLIPPPRPPPSSRTPPPAVARLNVPPPATSPRPHARIPSPSYPGVNHQTPPTSSPLLPTQQTPVSRLNPPPPAATASWPALAKSTTRQLSNFPTSRKVGKSKSRQAEKLASWHTPPAGPGRGEQRSTPPRTPCSSPTFPSSPPPHLRSPLPRLTPPLPVSRLNPPPLPGRPGCARLHNDMTALCNECTMQSLHSAITTPLLPLLLPVLAAFFHTTSSRRAPPPNAAKRPTCCTLHPAPARPLASTTTPRALAGTRIAAKPPTLYPPPPRHPFLLPPGKPRRPRARFLLPYPGVNQKPAALLLPSATQPWHHLQPTLFSLPPLAYTPPTSQQIEKPTSRKVGKHPLLFTPARRIVHTSSQPAFFSLPPGKPRNHPLQHFRPISCCARTHSTTNPCRLPLFSPLPPGRLPHPYPPLYRG